MEAQGRGGIRAHSWGTRKSPTPKEGRDCPRWGSGGQRQSETLIPARRAACHMAASRQLSRAPLPHDRHDGAWRKEQRSGSRGHPAFVQDTSRAQGLTSSVLELAPSCPGSGWSQGQHWGGGGGFPSPHNPPRAPTQFCHPATTASTHHEAPRLKPQVLYFCCQK